jgi:hypothetical protein
MQNELPPQEKRMQKLHLYLGSLLVGVALIAPAAIQANDGDRSCPNNGYYDRDRKDCHAWDDHEGRAYRAWEKAQHKTDREFSRLKDKEQSEYWKWRHEHPDHDDDRR